MTIEELLAMRQDLIAAEGGLLFLGKFERWYDAHLFRCTDGHVSSRVLKSEGLGRDACLAGTKTGQCLAPVVMTFPEDTDDPQ